MTVYNVTGVDESGATDSTAAILAFIASVPDGTLGNPNTIRFPTVTLRVDGTLLMTSRNHLILDGNGGTLQAVELGGRGRSHWSAVTCSHIRWTDFTIIGSNPKAGLNKDAYSSAYESQHAFESYGSTDITIDNNTVSQIWGDWTYFQAYQNETWTERVLVENNMFINNGRQGISFLGCRDAEVRNNTTIAARHSTIDFEPNNSLQGCDNIWIHDNTFGNQRLTFIAAGGYSAVIQNITIEDNTATRFYGDVNPPGFNLRRNFVFRRNTASGAMGAGSGFAMTFRRVDGLILTDNYQAMEPGRGMTLFLLIDCDNYEVSGNVTPDGSEVVYRDTGAVITDVDPTESDVAQADLYEAPTVVAAVGGGNQWKLAIDLVVPDEALVDDVAFLVTAHRGVLNAAPAGFTSVGDLAYAGNGASVLPFSLRAAAKRLTAEDLGSTVRCAFTDPSLNSTQRHCAEMVILRGVGNMTPRFVEGHFQYGPKNPVFVGAETTVPNSLVLFAAAHARGDVYYLPGEPDIDSIDQVRYGASSNGVSLGIGSVAYEGTGTGRQRTFNGTFGSTIGAFTVAFDGVLPPQPPDPDPDPDPDPPDIPDDPDDPGDPEEEPESALYETPFRLTVTVV